ARLLHQAHGALAHFRGKLVCVVLAHGSHSLKSESLRKTRGDSKAIPHVFGFSLFLICMGQR
ncbi:hypothetical protein, partial [Cupriavidus gilardii]|uniref:hypothetical protein n=1 Tax=Cupriavidus gilardii TaxID=82541 RepID=UPI0024053141